MDAEEIGRLIGELETRVERLRALYEQYFMGIERLEPLTVRKDIDRRLWALRREQIRNTGLRFKLETTIQRYNTYQQYWQRIVREIEAGTYQRDLGRAAQRFGDNAVTAFAKRRQKMFEKGIGKKAERDALRRTGPTASQAPPADAIEEAPPSSNETLDVTFEDDAAEPASSRVPVLASPEPHEPLELEISEPAPPPPPRPPRREAPVAPAARVAAPVMPAAEPRKGPHPQPAAAPRAPGPGAQGNSVGAAPPAYAQPPALAANPVVARPAPAVPPPPPPRAPLASSSGQGLAKPGVPAAPPAKPGASVAIAAKPATPVATPAKPAASAPKVPPPPISPARPEAGPPPPAARPPAASRPDAPGPAVLSEDNSLSPIRMRQIYGAFVEAKRKANESTASVTYEKIASNLENVAKELRAKHKARSVDFEVVMKNGKPVLKPVVKG